PEWKAAADGTHLTVLFPTTKQENVQGILVISFSPSAARKDLAIHITPFGHHEGADIINTGSAFLEEVHSLAGKFRFDVKRLFTQDFAWLLALAFAGGLILNIMPCVLPVIS